MTDTDYARGVTKPGTNVGSFAEPERGVSTHTGLPTVAPLPDLQPSVQSAWAGREHLRASILATREPAVMIDRPDFKPNPNISGPVERNREMFNALKRAGVCGGPGTYNGSGLTWKAQSWDFGKLCSTLPDPYIACVPTVPAMFAGGEGMYLRTGLLMAHAFATGNAEDTARIEEMISWVREVPHDTANGDEFSEDWLWAQAAVNVRDSLMARLKFSTDPNYAPVYIIDDNDLYLVRSSYRTPEGLLLAECTSQLPMGPIGRPTCTKTIAIEEQNIYL
jgi:hypothetical protein